MKGRKRKKTGAKSKAKKITKIPRRRKTRNA
jgi:hypothetical protein